MKNLPRLTLLVCLLAAAGTAGLSIARDQPAPEQAATDNAPKQGVAASSSDDRFKELGLEDIVSAFTRETVLKLNAIVSRSLDAVTRYDDEIPKMEKAVKLASAPDADDQAQQEAEAALALLRSLSEQASAAHADMLVASEQVRTSGEVYNAPLLSGMNRFVRRVDEEILEKLQSLSAALHHEEHKE